jgi:hypothetical protein
VIIRSLDADGDWNFGQGLSSYKTAGAAIAQDVATRLLTFRNDAFWATDFGVDWWNLLGRKLPAAEVGVLTQTRNMIIGSPGGYPASGVVAINSVSAVFDGASRRLSVTYSINDIYSTTTVGTVTPGT